MPRLNLTILVADDEERFRHAIADAFRFFNCVVEEAGNGRDLEAQALRLAESGRDFLMIVDNQMPEHPGATEQQWCGLETVIQLCRDYPKYRFQERVLFLSRWGIGDLPNDRRGPAGELGLLCEARWKPVAIPFSELMRHVRGLVGTSRNG